MSQGKVKFFKSEKGYGFISSNDKDYFVHISQCGNQPLQTDDEVEFEIATGKKGVEARNVVLI